VMDITESFSQLLSSWFDVLISESGMWQLSVIAISIAIARMGHLRWHAYITQRLGIDEQAGFRRFALRGSGKIIFPLIMLLVVLVGQAILTQYKLDASLLNVLIPLLLSLAVIRIIVYTLRRAYGPSKALRAWEGVISTLIWIVVALHLLGLLPAVMAGLDGPAVTFAEIRISILSLIKLILITAVLMVLARWLSRVVERRAQRSEHISASMQIGLAKFTKVLLYTVAIMIALDSVGIDLTALTVFGGALGVGLGFGLQRIASNFISGFILLFDRSVKPGDVITIGNRFGWVVALYARYIVVRDRDGVETLIPNENLITSEVINWSYSDRHVRVRIPVQISYSDDPEAAMQIMLDASKANDRVLEHPAPQVRMLSFGDNGINLELRLWLSDPEEGVGSVKSDVNLSIWKGFKEHKITIPFPQRDVRMINETS